MSCDLAGCDSIPVMTILLDSMTMVTMAISEDPPPFGSTPKKIKGAEFCSLYSGRSMRRLISFSGNTEALSEVI